MRYFLIAGEASGDLHGSNLIHAIRERDADAEFRVWGGDKMKAAGGNLRKHYRDMDFMGFWEVVQNLPTILANLRECHREIEAWQPDVVIPIDYPGFNLRIAKFAHKKGFKVYYYISPQLWAWNVQRVKLVRRYVDHMFVILPFEKEFYEQYGVDVDFVGHPLLDAMEGIEKDPGFRDKHKLHDYPVVAVLPGSRKQEIQRKLPEMIKLAGIYREHIFVVAGVTSVDQSLYAPFVDQPNVRLAVDDTYQLLHHADLAIVTSGTATLETALFNVPQIVCYKGGWLSYQIGRQVVKVDHISLVNLIMKEEVVKELIQQAFNIRNLEEAFEDLLNPDSQERMQKKYRELRQKLGKGGASTSAAEKMIHYLNDQNIA